MARLSARGFAGTATRYFLLALVVLQAAVLQGSYGYDWRFEDEGRRIVRSLGTNSNGAVKEISGVVASRSQIDEKKDGEAFGGGVLWSHNDSGSGPLLFALNASTGEHLAWFELQGDNVPNQDWEDIAIGPGPIFGQDYLYVGDIGGHRNEKTIIRFPEPKLPYYHNAVYLRSVFDENEAEVQSYDPWELVPITKFDVIRFRYPSGKASDCESLTVDPITGDIFIASKHNNRLDVYVLHYRDIELDGINELKLHYSSCNDPSRTGTDECEVCREECVDSIADFNTLVAADISPSGYGLIMSDYARVFYWRRNFLNESFFEYEPQQLPYQNRHGTEEALCWSWDSKGYFVVPEGSYPELRYYPYSGEAWWSQIRDYFGSCYAFIHMPSPAASIMSLAEGASESGDEIDNSAAASCIPVPCSEISVQRQQAAANLVSFFRDEGQCQIWQDFYNKMTTHDVAWLQGHNNIEYLEVDLLEEYSFIHEDFTDIIEGHYRTFAENTIQTAEDTIEAVAAAVVGLP